MPTGTSTRNHRGIYMTPSKGLPWIISTAHTMHDSEALIAAVDEVRAGLV
jgi:glutamate-1-semialdehyde aminotransferase